MAQSFIHDKTMDGGKLFENVPQRITSISLISNLQLVCVLREGESSIYGDTTLRRTSRHDTNFGQLDAEYLLEHQNEIPAEFRKYHIFFPGTIWEYRYGLYDGDHQIPVLYWNRDCGRWSIDFHIYSHWSLGVRLLIGDTWYPNFRLIRFRDNSFRNK